MNNYKTNRLVLKSINQLFEYSFFIPSYQRGYRWTSKQVTQLLEDIWQFSNRDGKTKGEFYCLQPIVVKKMDDDRFEVIDGQQRYTTMFLIVKHLEDMIKFAFPSFTASPPDYETRSDSSDFLTAVKAKTNGDAQSNIDYFHIWNAYNTIKNWFENKDNNINAIDFLNVLLKYKIEELNGNQIDVANNVRVIWYEINEAENNNSIDIFTRLNIGKIPLTNAELIKALFLQKSNFTEDKATLKQIQIASEWDIMEKTLQDDAFWFFIYNPTNPLKYDNRIEYIFDLMKDKVQGKEDYYTFNAFADDFTEKKPVDEIWLSIKQYFLTFEEWYKDYVLFHYIGYLVECDNNIIKKIKKEGTGKTKVQFKEYLKDEIKNQVNHNIDELAFNNDKKIIKKVLLLFNLQTVLETQKSDMRFPFHKYKAEKWDIEHISSQTDKKIDAKNQLAWLNDILEYFTGTNDIEKAVVFIENNQTDEKMSEIRDICNDVIILRKADKIETTEFEKVFNLVKKYFKEEQTESKHDISNLALLDATTNRSYGNAFFPIKRKRIIENDKNGIFVPICTKNLFLKYYSKKGSEIMYWTDTDANDYLDGIKLTLKTFLPHKTTNHEE